MNKRRQTSKKSLEIVIVDVGLVLEWEEQKFSFKFEHGKFCCENMGKRV